jgi:hypothetical protein
VHGRRAPTTLDIPNGLARGVRTASDFLMALQLTGAAKRDSIANLQLRLPVVVIGGGLTAIDTATESLAYYVRAGREVPRAPRRTGRRARRGGGAAGWSDGGGEVAAEFLSHAAPSRAERARAARRTAGTPDFIGLLRPGAASRSPIAAADRQPVLHLNHEEVAKALEEGIRFAECLTRAVESTRRAPCARSRCAQVSRRRRPLARRDDRAAGTRRVHRRRHPAQHRAGARRPRISARRQIFPGDRRTRPAVRPEHAISKPGQAQVLLHARPTGACCLLRRPASQLLRQRGQGDGLGQAGLSGRLAACWPPGTSQAGPLADSLRRNDLLRARVERVERLTPTIVEVVVHAPMAARKFQPGQFYRLQNFECWRRRRFGGMPTRLAWRGWR